MTEQKNRFDEKYEIRLAAVEDIDKIMKFIQTDWKAGHILAVNRPFFEFEFLEEDGTVNFVIALDRETGMLEGMVGFLKASKDREHLDIWGSMWKVRQGTMPLLGTELIRRRVLLSKCRSDLGIGNNPKTATLVFQTLLHRKVGKMKQFYRLADREDFKIARVVAKPEKRKPYVSEKEVRMIRFSSVEELTAQYDLAQNQQTVPYKDAWYLDHRFFHHMMYQYKVYGIEVDGAVEAVFVIREQPYEDRIAVRIVDYIGQQEAFARTGGFWEQMLAGGCYEYADFYCLGFAEEFIYQAGFSIRKDEDPNVIPNYFSPFEQKNIEIWTNWTEGQVLFCRADGDQDRPSMM